MNKELKELPESVCTGPNFTYSDNTLPDPGELDDTVNYKELYVRAYREYHALLTDFVIMADDYQINDDNFVGPLKRIEEKQNIISQGILKIVHFLEDEWTKKSNCCSQR